MIYPYRHRYIIKRQCQISISLSFFLPFFPLLPYLPSRDIKMIPNERDTIYEGKKKKTKLFVLRSRIGAPTCREINGVNDAYLFFLLLPVTKCREEAHASVSSHRRRHRCLSRIRGKDSNSERKRRTGCLVGSATLRTHAAGQIVIGLEAN